MSRLSRGTYSSGMKTGILTVALIAAVSLPSVYPQIADYPLIEVFAREEGTQLIFEASWPAPANDPSKREPVTVFDLSIYSKGWNVLLWQIVTPNYVGATSRIVYGRLPRGYQQTMPDKRDPPKLKAGEPYRVSLRGGGGIGWVEFQLKADK